MQQKFIHCDGSSLANPGFASGGFYVEGSNHIKCHGYLKASNNHVELHAMLMALNYIASLPDKEQQWFITTDSGYVFDGLTKYAPGWVTRHWKGVKNVELFRPTYHLYKVVSHRVELLKVKGHSDHLGNRIINDAVQMHSRLVRDGTSPEGSYAILLEDVFKSHPIIYKEQLAQIQS